MPRHAVDIHNYAGQGSAYPLGRIPDDRAQEIVGFCPGRRGILEQAPLLKRIRRALPFTYVHGVAVYYSKTGKDDRVLIFYGTKIYAAALTTFTSNRWKYDEKADGQHSELNLLAFWQVTNPYAINASTAPVSGAQFDDELILCVGNRLLRYYVDDDGVERLYRVGLHTPRQPSITSAAQLTGTDLASSNGTAIRPTVTSATHKFTSAELYETLVVTAGVNWTAATYTIVEITAAGGAVLDKACGSADSLSSGSYRCSGVSAGLHDYRVTYEDERGRESSPSDYVSITISSADQRVLVTRSPGTAPYVYYANGCETYWNLYRRNPGSEVFNKVARIAYGTTTYTDIHTDDVVNQGDACPHEGQNDPPGTDTGDPPGIRGEGATWGLTNALCVWNSRLLVNDLDDPTRLRMSNQGSPTQFSTLELPESVNDGINQHLQGRGQNVITGFCSLGSLCAIFSRQHTTLLYGDDITDIRLRAAQERGCQNPNSIQRCEQYIIFASDDGVYAVGYEDGFNVTRLSGDIDDLFRGFAQMTDPQNPASLGRPASIQVTNAQITGMNSLYVDRRYYLSMGNRTLCMDIDTKAWTDTGWGFMRCAARYFSQRQDRLSTVGTGYWSCPETAFICLGDHESFGQQLLYFTVADTPLDELVPATFASHVVMRPWKDEGSSDIRAKRPGILSVFGECTAKRGVTIGTVRWFCDGHMLAAAPIWNGVTWKRKGAMFEVQAPDCTGERVWAELSFTVTGLKLSNIIAEYSYVN